jgi:outer membrane immunogenic protein
MKKLFLVTISLFTAMLGGGLTARAADIAPVYKAAPAYAPYNWTGLYVGGVVGYGWGTNKHCDAGGCTLDFDVDGWNAGATIGYNWQWANWVLGIEGDGSWANIKGSTPDSGCGGSGTTCDTKIKSFETIRGRVGYAFDRFLPYVTAGVAFTQLEASAFNPVVSRSTTKSSFTVGAGLEYAFLPNWSAKLEYLYVSKLSDFIYAPSPPLECTTPGCFVSDVDYSVVRLGINYRFGGL